MSPDSIPQFSLGTAALIIFAVCAGFVILRGLTRMIVGTVVLGISAWIGFRVWQIAPELSIDWVGKPVGWVNTGLPVAAFLVSYLLIRKIAKSMTSPVGGDDETPSPGGSSRMISRLLLALIPTGLLWLIGATLLHHAGSVAEIRNSAGNASGRSESAATGFTRRLKGSIDSALPASWIRALDPLADPDRLTLAKLLATRSFSKLEPVIDPKTGHPYPRAIIVDDPEIRNLVREEKFATLLRHPLLTKALADPTVRKLLKDRSL